MSNNNVDDDILGTEYGSLLLRSGLQWTKSARGVALTK